MRRKKKLLIEVYGHPGAGKSTVCNRLDRNPRITVHRNVPRVFKLGCFLFFCARWPVASAKIVFMLLREHCFRRPSWSMLRYKAPYLMVAFSDYARAYLGKTGVHVVEEGPRRRLLLLFDDMRADDRAALEKLYSLQNCLPKPDLIVALHCRREEAIRRIMARYGDRSLFYTAGGKHLRKHWPGKLEADRHVRKAVRAGPVSDLVIDTSAATPEETVSMIEERIRKEFPGMEPA